MLLEPIEAGSKVRSASSNRGERNRLPSLIRLDILNRGVEIEHLDQSRSLPGQDRPNL